MALSIVSILRQYQSIDQEQLAQSFAHRYNSARKYGASMRGLFLQILEGVPWQEAAQSLFGGQGSFGNGAAMRVAPVGAYFADDLNKASEQARRSAEITHANIEGIAGAIAVAVATALAWQYRTQNKHPEWQTLIQAVLPFVPESEVQSRLCRAVEINSPAAHHAAAMLGNGLQISAQDTVPFCLWSAAHFLEDYQEAIWQTASVGGDIDTNCAIVSGIVALYTGLEGIPSEWRKYREPLPSWPLLD